MIEFENSFNTTRRDAEKEGGTITLKITIITILIDFIENLLRASMHCVKVKAK